MMSRLPILDPVFELKDTSDDEVGESSDSFIGDLSSHLVLKSFLLVLAFSIICTFLVPLSVKN